MNRKWIFRGHIAGIGTTSGLRAVVGVWDASPFGAFADVMVELPDGHRILLAPDAQTAGFIAGTYLFDETRILPVRASLADGTLDVLAGPLRLRASLGSATALGLAASLVPRRLAVHPLWLRAVSPVAGLLSPGVRTAGAAAGGRREFYGVTGLRRIDAAVVSWDGADAGTLAPIRPAVGFGFSSVPAAPCVATVQTTVIESR